MDEQRQHLEALRQTHRRRLQELEKQAAVFGLNTPPHILIEADDIRLQIAQIEKQIGSVRGQLLPLPVADFAGRETEITQLVNILTRSINQGKAATISGVRGMGGIGKTELALAVAQQLVDRFPDGQVLVNLRGATSSPLKPALAIQAVIRSLINQPILPNEIEELQTVYHATLAGKHVFVLADDAKDATQVRPLLPPTGCALLITSRQRFILPGMAVVDLETLPADKASDLLRTICPRIGSGASELAKLCGYLPLALRVSASLLANDDTRSIEQYIEKLTDEKTRLAELKDPDDPSLNVEASIQLSFDTLDGLTQHALCQLSIISKGFDLATANAIVELQENVRIEDLLGLLRRRCLLDWDQATQHYSLHDLIRAFAAARLSDPMVGTPHAVTSKARNQAALLAVQRRRLAYRMKQQERLGDLVSPEVTFDIDDTRSSIRDLKTDLRLAGIAVADNPIDDKRVVIRPAVSFSTSAWRNRNSMLQRVGNVWVKGVLENSLFSNNILVELGLSYMPHNLAISGEHSIKQSNQDEAIVSSNSIIDVFDENRGSLLILGEPGSGKTTLLLQLARDLIARAQQDSNYPMPVVFNLSSWTNKFKLLEEWLLEELTSKYSVPRKVSQFWIDNDQILPLLDGLDEVPYKDHQGCLQAITRFSSERESVQLVVCSRDSEYTVIKARLILSGAVSILPLTNYQIDSFLALAGQKFNSLRILIAQDQAFQELAKSPLMLSVLLVASGELSIEGLPAQHSFAENRTRLFDAYVNKMLSENRRKENIYGREQTMRGLTWLAHIMINNNIIIIRPEDISLKNRFGASLNGTLPWKITRFLDYCVERVLLRKVGGGYIFLHRLLLEYFAKLDLESING